MSLRRCEQRVRRGGAAAEMIDPPVAVGVPVAAHVRAVPPMTGETVPLDAWRGIIAPVADRSNPRRHAARWSCCACLALAMMLALAWARERSTPAPPVGLETAWIAPRLCRGIDQTRFYGISGVETGISVDGAAMLPCQDGQMHSTSQSFELPESLGWGAPGSVESLVVFRGGADELLISFTLQDANGVSLLEQTGLRFPAEDAVMTPGLGKQRSLKAIHSHVSSGRHGVSSGHNVPSAGVRTWYRTHTAGAVGAGTIVALMHHRRGGHAGCNEPAYGCEYRIDRVLALDIVEPNFTITNTTLFPLHLTISQCDVWRASDGTPAVYLSFYSADGGARLKLSERIRGDALVSWAWLPILISVVCCMRALRAMDSNRFLGGIVILGLTLGLQQVLYWLLAGMPRP
jgi:hypothetical protein